MNPTDLFFLFFNDSECFIDPWGRIHLFIYAVNTQPNSGQPSPAPKYAERTRTTPPPTDRGQKSKRADEAACCPVWLVLMLPVASVQLFDVYSTYCFWMQNIFAANFLINTISNINLFHKRVKKKSLVLFSFQSESCENTLTDYSPLPLLTFLLTIVSSPVPCAFTLRNFMNMNFSLLAFRMNIWFSIRWKIQNHSY